MSKPIILEKIAFPLSFPWNKKKCSDFLNWKIYDVFVLFCSDGKLHDVEITAGGGGKIVNVREDGQGGKVYQVGK